MSHTGQGQLGLSGVSQESFYGSHTNQPFWGLLVSDCRVTPTSCLPLTGIVIAYSCCILYLPVFSTLPATSKCPPPLQGSTHPSWPHLVGSAQGCGNWNLEHLLAYAYSCILPACWGTSSDSGPGIPLDCSPQTLGQEVAMSRARQRLAVGMGGGRRELCPGDSWQVGWRGTGSDFVPSSPSSPLQAFHGHK